MIDEATKTEKELVDPLLQFRNWGLQLANNWSTTSNNAPSGSTTLPAQRLPNPTSSSTLRLKQNISTRTWTLRAHD
jgi:hypothetical protein